MSEPALEIEGLSWRVRGFALDDVSLRVPRGSVMGLIGRNGAGKSTLMRCVMGLLVPDAGTIRVFGLDHRKDGVAARRRIGFVYDEPCFFADATLEAHRDAIAPFYPTWDDRTFDRLVRAFGLRRDRRFQDLSHGQKTKFALALALSHDADLLLLDEPTTGLDPVFRHELLDRLAEVLLDEGKSILFSTHHVTDLERIADAVTCIDDGRVVFSLEKDALLDTWGVVKGDAAVVDAVPPDHRRGVRRGAFGVEILTSDAAAARRTLGDRAVVDRATLEDVMVLLLGDRGRNGAA